MKFIKYFSLGIFLLSLFASCSNELDLNAPYKNIPVIYGVLSVKDTSHYIRIQKVFTNPSGDATAYAKNIDSVYYKEDDIIVQLVDKNLKTWTLRRVDGNLEGYKRESGVFVDSPNYLYKIKGDSLKLAGGEKVKISVLDKKTNAIIASSETTITKNMSEISPAIPGEINFASTLPNSLNSLYWGFDQNTTKFFNVKMFLNIDETDVNNPTKLISRRIPWQIVPDFDISNTFVINSKVNIKYSVDDFFTVIKNYFKDSGSTKKYFRNLDLEITAVNNDVYGYLNASTVNTGITAAEVVPNYTNIANGLGLFGSKNNLNKYGITVKTQTLDSLKYGSVTKSLNFQ